MKPTKTNVCELCGSEGGYITTIEVDGVKLAACSKCAKFGKPIVRKKAPQSPKIERKTPIPQKKPPQRKVIRPEKEFFQDRILIEDYGEIIRNARTERGIGRAEFAAMIKEKETLIARIESEKIVPTDRIVDKIERELNIELRTEVIPEVSALEDVISQTSTIGSIAKIKRKKKN